MTIYLILSVVAALVGAFMFYASANPKHVRMGEMLCFAGLLSFLLGVAR